MSKYSETAAKWLEDWDKGETVWTIEMGGLSPRHEQCIHICCAEYLRSLIAIKADPKRMADDKEYQIATLDICENSDNVQKCFSQLGMSRAQAGAAKYIAARFYMDTPKTCLEREEVKYRKILVDKNFPQLA